MLEEEEYLQNDNRKYVELGYLKVILDFFNYHVSLARREHLSKLRTAWLVKNLLPSFSELRESL